MRSENNHITAGGVVENSNGEWITDFVANIGVGSLIAAKLQGVFYGLKNCWAMDKTQSRLKQIVLRCVH